MKRSPRIAAKAGLAASLTAAMLVSACGAKTTGNASDTGAKSSATGADLTAAAKAEGTVDYWSEWGEAEPQAKIFAAEAAAFTAATGIKVNIKYLGRDGTKTLPQDIAAGNGPDMFSDGTDHIVAYEAQNMIAPIDDLLTAPIPGENGKTLKDLVSAGAIKASSDPNGHLVLYPHTLMTLGLWYDAARSPEITSEIPKTWNDFLGLLAKEKAAGKTPLSQDGLVPFYNVFWFYQLAVRAGGPGTVANLAKDPKNWDDPAVIRAASEVAKLAPYFQSGFMGSKYPAAQNDWAQGKEVFNLNGSWLASETKPQAKPDADPRIFPFPQLDGGTDSVEVGTLGWSVSAKAKHPHAAELFLTYLLSKEPQTKISTDALNIPARTDIAAPASLKGIQDAISAATKFTATYDGASADAKWWNDVLLPLDDKLLAGKLSPADFVAQGKKQTADALANS